MEVTFVLLELLECLTAPPSDLNASRKSRLIKVHKRGLHNAVRKRKKSIAIVILFIAFAERLCNALTSKSSIIAQRK